MKTKQFAIVALIVCLFSILTNNALAFYNPQTGHWLSRDPIAEQAGPNIYEFTWNSATVFFDTDGRQSLQIDAFVDTAFEVAPRVSVAGEGSTTTGSSGGPGTFIDVAPRPVGQGLYPPATITTPQPSPQPQTVPNQPDITTEPNNLSPKNQDLLYRSMAPSGNSPIIGENAQALGVRPNPPQSPNYDVLLKGDMVSDFDTTKNMYQGMSVAPGTPLYLPPFRLPRGLINWQGVAGTGKSPVWQISRYAINGKLNYLEDSDGRHGLIAPASCMKYSEYKQALENTRLFWKLTDIAPFQKK